MNPPRALWVPFPLGRPLGKPNDPVFQRDVIQATLSLLEYAKGTVLVDYPREVEEEPLEIAIPACPVDFSGRDQPLSDVDKLFLQFQAELGSMASWYSLAQEHKKRTTSGVSGLTHDEIVVLYDDFIRGGVIPDGDGKATLADTLRLAAEDVKAYYLEAIVARPGQPTDARILADWFWGSTCAAAVIDEVRKKALSSGDVELQLLGKLLLVPRNQLHRFVDSH